MKKNDPIAQFTSDKLSDEKLKYRSEMDQASQLEKEYLQLHGRTNNRDAQRDLELKRSEARGKYHSAETKWKSVNDQIEKLLLRAPRDGTVMGLPKIDERYKTWEEKDLETPFCSIGDPHQLRVLVPIGPADYELIRTDLEKRRKEGRTLDVTIRVQGMEGRTWTGRVTHLPQSADKTIPLALSTKGGGPLAVKPTSQPGQLEPQSQVYLVGIDFEQPDRDFAAIVPGSMAQVKVHCEYRSCAWWTWRTLSATFDIGLL